MTSFDAMDGAVFGFGPTKSDLTIRAGRAPLELEQLLLSALPSEFKFQALVVWLVRGERNRETGHTQINSLVAVLS